MLLTIVGCITIPLGDPEKAKVDDKLLGAWMTKPDENGGQTLFTVLPFGSARTGRIWPDASPAAFAIVAATAVVLTAAALLPTTRRAVRGPATAAMRA